jgi:hypothetical protein
MRSASHVLRDDRSAKSVARERNCPAMTRSYPAVTAVTSHSVNEPRELLTVAFRMSGLSAELAYLG